MIVIALFSFEKGNAIADCKQAPGALVLAHGSDHREHHDHFVQAESSWNATVLATVEEAKKQIPFPVEVAFGMWDKKSFDAGVKKLAQQGVCELRVVPLFISSHSEMIDVQKYMFGVGGRFELPISVKQVEIPPSVKIVKFGKGLDDHEAVSDILYERAMELSQSPSTEGLLLVAHGPFGDAYELEWIKDLKIHAQRIESAFQNTGKKTFSEISYSTLRDDSPPATRNQRTQELRDKVEEFNRRGLTPIVLPVLLSRGGIEDGLIERLSGLRYKIQDRFLMPHQKMVDWIVASAFQAP
jgi:sirohydrochlorin ferrochelatase